ncbi:hypothetical protein AAG570_004950 [Ranatra chinensis]|uniref:Protein-S-isoprenylcysteine O-methyltransferase n=1 Tax=Ranatra chinensis TaxID=642074 RepID=A0ABD0XZ12_9HEMI
MPACGLHAGGGLSTTESIFSGRKIPEKIVRENGNVAYLCLSGQPDACLRKAWPQLLRLPAAPRYLLSVRMLVDEGKLSLFCFLIGVSSCYPMVLPMAGYHGPFSLLEAVRWYFLAIYSAIFALITRLALRGRRFQVGIRALFLGCAFSAGLHIAHVNESYRVFGWYMCVMAFFHYSEFLTIAVSNPDTLSVDSFILNHSPQYKIAAVSSWIEFWIEHALWPGLLHPLALRTLLYSPPDQTSAALPISSSFAVLDQQNKTARSDLLRNERFVPDLKNVCWPLSALGLFVCVCGEAVRKLAMLTARTNFNHVVQSEKRPDHTLVTHGVYSLCRHPAYAGWFYWAVGTQMILVNPVCIVAYLAASWKFFKDRITIEEVTLLNFFQYDYVLYQDRIPTGLPFIRGYPIKDL